MIFYTCSIGILSQQNGSAIFKIKIRFYRYVGADLFL